MPSQEAIMADTRRFPDSEWNEIVSIIASAFNFDGSKKSKLAAAPTPKLIAALPYLAGCREPRRTALAHLATYIVAESQAGRASFDHKAGDNYDVLARLSTIANFEGGDPVVLNRGMKRLATVMIRGYQKDLDSDKSKGLYNPILAGGWNGDEKLKNLDSAIASTKDDEMDAISPAVPVAGAFWGPDW